MTKPCPFATAAVALLLASGAGAQTTVYESRDAAGNVTYSDESSPDSKAIEIQKTDVVDAPKPMPADPDEESPERDGRPAAEEPDAAGGTETIYGDRYDYPDDDPRLRREAVRERGDPGAIEGDEETIRQDERQGAASYDERNSGDPIEDADREAERSDVSGPDAEYRNTEHPVHREGGRR